MATDVTVARVTQAGAMPIDTYAVLAEIMSTWNRPDAMDFAAGDGGPHRPALSGADGELRQGAERAESSANETKLDRLDAARGKPEAAKVKTPA